MAEEDEEVEELRIEASGKGGGPRERRHAAVRRESSSSLKM